MQQTLTSDDVVLRVEGLRTEFPQEDGTVVAVDGVDLEMRRGATLAVVGESGCGKSVMARSILQLVDRPGRIVGGQVWVPAPEALPSTGRGRRRREARHVRSDDGLVGLVGADDAIIRSVRGKRISMVFQEPMTSLSSVHRVGDQIAETICLHEGLSKRDARERVIDLLRRVGIPGPEKRVDAYPFQLSGGMRQRIMIAMALSCNPELLIADEPTTALDVTTQAQILELLKDLQDEFDMAIMLITHDLGVAAQVADDVAVMYLGQVVERGDVRTLFTQPQHPYTQALLRSVPKLGHSREERLMPVRGVIPHPLERPSGCRFRDRCDHFMAGICDVAAPPVIEGPDGGEVRCFLYEKDNHDQR